MPYMPRPRPDKAKQEGEVMQLEDKDNRSISFKNPVALDQFSKALKHFGNAFKILAGREAKYTDFTDWLITQDFVEVGLSQADIDEMMKKASKANA